MEIKDSGDRTQFDTGAVRDMIFKGGEYLDGKTKEVL